MVILTTCRENWKQQYMLIANKLSDLANNGGEDATQEKVRSKVKLFYETKIMRKNVLRRFPGQTKK